MAFTYDPIFAFDPNNPANIARSASITLFDPADLTQSPITITDPTGVPIPNPITVDAQGMGPAFQHPTLARVGWKGAGFVNYLTSYEGMYNETQDAKEAAQNAANEAASAAADRVTAATVTGGKLILTKATGATVDAGSVIGPKGDKGDKGLDGSNVLPTSQAIAQEITNPGTPTATALNATYATASAVAAKLDKTEAASTYATPAAIEAQVPPLVSAALASDEAPALAAAAAVDGALEDAGVVSGAATVESYEVGGGFTDQNNRRLWLEWAADGGPTEAVTEELRTKLGVLNEVHVPDSITEWSYVLPLACALTKPSSRIVGGSIGSGGGRGTLAPVYVWEWAPGMGVKQVVVGQTPTDDHNCPAVYAEDGWRTVLIWTDHGYSASTIPGAQLTEELGSLHLVVSDQGGNIETMAESPITHIPTADDDGSYAAIYRIKHLCTYNPDGSPAVGVYWSIGRALAGSWWITEITVNQATGAVSHLTKQLITNPTKYYLTSSEVHGAAQQTLRFGTYPHPQESTHAVHYFELNCVTGAITSPVDPAINANYSTGVGMPLAIANFGPLIPDYGTAGTHSRRLIAVRPGPAAPAVLYADWELSNPDAAVYKVREVLSGETVEHGVAGKRIGYFDWANYLGGANFPNPAYDKTLVVTRFDGTVSSLEERRVGRDGTVTATTLTTSDDHRVARPFQPMGGSTVGWLYNALTKYDPEGYRDYESTIRSTRNEK